MRSILHLKSLGLSLLLAAAACSAPGAHEDPASETPTSETPIVETPGANQEQTNPASTEEPVPPCDETEAARLQKTIDDSHSAKTDVVAAIKTPSCGVRFFTSGPSKVTNAHLHRIGSVSKTFTGAIVLKLIDEKKLSLDDPASRWLTGIPGGDGIRVRNLLQHTSGLAPSDQLLQPTPAQSLSYSFQQPLEFEPGSTFAYRNVNFVALGVIAEKVTGKALVTLVRENIATPLDLKSTFFEGGETINGTLATPRNAQGQQGTYNVHPSRVWAAGNVVSTPENTLTWIENLEGGKFLSAELTAEMKKPRAYAADSGYGLAMMHLGPSTTSGGGDGFGHYGDLIAAGFSGQVGYHTAAFYFPAKKTTVVVILDFTPSPLSTLRDPFFAVLKTLFAAK